MKHIETNFLIYDLAQKYIGKLKVSQFSFIFMTMSVSIMFILAALLNSNLRDGLDIVLKNPEVNFFYIQLTVFSLCSFFGCYLSYKYSMPGQTEGILFNVINFSFYLLWLGLFSINILLVFKYGFFSTENILDFNSIKRTLLGMTIPTIVLLYFISKGYVINSYKTIILVMLTAFSFASFLNLFICPVTNYSHVLVSHNLVVLPVILIAVLLLKSFKS